MKKMTLLIVALSFSIIAIAQISVTGIVTNDSIPLESASVIIKNSTKGIETTVKGEFKLEAKKGDTLSISYLGYETKELVVNGSKSLEVKLVEGNSLKEVVIVGYVWSTKTAYCCGGSRICIINETKNIIKNKLYPNPSSNGIFQLKLNNDYEEVNISIANISGQIIQNSTHQKFGKKVTLDISQYATGIYIVSIIADGKRLESIKAVRG